jgi:hypothetical protein
MKKSSVKFGLQHRRTKQEKSRQNDYLRALPKGIHSQVTIAFCHGQPTVLRLTLWFNKSSNEMVLLTIHFFEQRYIS